MKIAQAVKSIVPDFEVYLDGYMKTRLVMANDDSTKAQVTILDFNSDKLLLVSLDIMGIWHKQALEIKKMISEKLNISVENIIIYATHCHSGVAMLGGRTVERSLVSQKYFEFLKHQILSSIEELEAKEVVVELEETDVSGYYGNRNIKEKDLIDKVKILHFMGEDNKEIATLINLATHPTVLDSSQTVLSSDIFGEIRKDYSKKYGIYPQIINGDCGDVSTRFFRESKDFNQVKNTGKGVVKQLGNQDKRKIALKFKSIGSVFEDVDYDPNSDDFVVSKKKELEKSKDKYAAYLLNILNKKKNLKYENRAKIIDLDQLYIVTFEGEIVRKIGEKIKDATDKPVIICAYADGYNGYMVDESDYGKYFETYKSELPKGSIDQLINKIIAVIQINERK